MKHLKKNWWVYLLVALAFATAGLIYTPVGASLNETEFYKNSGLPELPIYDVVAAVGEAVAEAPAQEASEVTIVVPIAPLFDLGTCAATNAEGGPLLNDESQTAGACQYGTAPVVEVPGQLAAPVEECSLTDGTAQVVVEKVGTEYVLDTANLTVVPGYNNTQAGHDASKLYGCDLYVEFELNREHHIVILRDDPTQGYSYVQGDVYHIPSPMGASAWVAPAGWNTCDLSTPKQPLCIEMAADKDINQERNGYDWAEVIHFADGSKETYEPGYVYASFYAECDSLTEPIAVYVAGTILNDGYNASIGIESCWIAVKLDGQWTYWRDAKDNVEYLSSAEAVLFPKTATEDDVKTWIASQ